MNTCADLVNQSLKNFLKLTFFLCIFLISNAVILHICLCFLQLTFIVIIIFFTFNLLICNTLVFFDFKFFSFSNFVDVLILLNNFSIKNKFDSLKLKAKLNLKLLTLTDCFI